MLTSRVFSFVFHYYLFRLITILIVSLRTKLDDAWDFLVGFNVRILWIRFLPDDDVLSETLSVAFIPLNFRKRFLFPFVPVVVFLYLNLHQLLRRTLSSLLKPPPAPAATKYLTPHHLPLSLPDLLSLVRSLPVTGAVAAQVLPSRSLSPLRYCVKTLPTCAHNIFGHLWNFTRCRTRSCRALRRSSPSSSSPPRWQLLYYLFEKECQVGISLVEEVFRVVERLSFSNVFSCKINSFGSSVLILSGQK